MPRHRGEYHKFWTNPTRDALQDYLDFSNRWNVPVMIGETGEYTNSWSETFRTCRKLNERCNIGRWFGGVEKGVALSPERVWSVLDAYLQAARLKNGRINAGYLTSLGLVVP
jgi:hypothetical protein